ncbi:MAG: hypothetical protein RBS19_09260 [Bacteroidales bacterium]|nr:hypothetical protein [Bacteroidales bacterium]
MKHKTGIKINRLQLSKLLNDMQKVQLEYLLNKDVYCGTCKKICENGVEVMEIYLNPLNDVMINGRCKVCYGKVARIIELSEDLEFFDKVNDYRKSIDK